MKTYRIPLLLAVLLCTGLAVWIWQLQVEVTDLKTADATAQLKLDVAYRHAKSATAEAEKWRKQAEDLLGSVPAVKTPDAADASKSEHKRNLQPDEVTAMMKNPAMRNIIGSQQAAIIQMTYHDLLDRLKLAPDERDYMQKLLVERQMNLVNLGSQMMNPNLSADDRSAIYQQLQQGEDASQAKIKDFLNDDADYASYQTYLKQEPERQEIGMFESSLTGDDSLDPTKADALAGLLSDTRKNFNFTVDFYNQSNFGNPKVLNTTSVNTFLDEQVKFQAQIAEKAADILTPAQMELFKQNQAASRQMSKMQLNNIVQMASGGQ